jgi:hypothetical protein
MKTKDIKILKERLYISNDRKCPILGIEVPIEKMALDHIHKLKSEGPSENKGTVRNAIEFRANALEGKITNNWKRYFGSDESKHPITLPEFLRNLADYLEAGAYVDEEGHYYIHPTEVPAEPKLGKREFTKIAKMYSEKNPTKKPLEYPKSGKWTKQLLELKEEFGV